MQNSVYRPPKNGHPHKRNSAKRPQKENSEKTENPGLRTAKKALLSKIWPRVRVCAGGGGGGDRSKQLTMINADLRIAQPPCML